MAGTDAVTKVARKVRSRAACLGCRSTKQRCDGPSRIPCRRCQLYGLQCEYPPANIKDPRLEPKSRHEALTDTTPALPASSADHVAPAASNSQSLGNGSHFGSPFAFPTLDGQSRTLHAEDLGMRQHLAEISARLQGIEASLSTLTIDASQSKTITPKPATSFQAPHSASTMGPGDSGDIGHAVQTVAGSIDLLEGLADGYHASEEGTGLNMPGTGSSQRRESRSPSASDSWPNPFDASPLPDALDRGVLTQQECEVSFRVFLRLLAPWAANGPSYDAPMLLRSESPLLFHVILLCTNYYLLSTERGPGVYHALTAIVNELVAPILISPIPAHLSMNTARALLLLVVYKPVQHAALWQSGIKDPSQAEHVSKLSSTSSTTLMHIVTRIAIATRLSDSPNQYLQSAQSEDHPDSVPSTDLVSAHERLRLWLTILIIDTHGTMTTGRSSSLDFAGALGVTRSLAGRRAHPWDVRIAAMVELYAFVKPIVATEWFGSCGHKPVDHNDLASFNSNLLDHSTYWRSQLDSSAGTRDRDVLAPLVLSLYQNLAKLTINVCAFAHWQRLRKIIPRPAMSDRDWMCIQHTLDAAEDLIFSLSVEARVTGKNIRQVQWPPAINGVRPKLTLDQVMVDAHKTAFDPIACVAYIYPLIMVAKIINAGLARCEMSITREDYERGTGPVEPRQLVKGAKYGELLILGADFLEAIAPTRTHPAHKHARLLRVILAAGSRPALNAAQDQEPVPTRLSLRDHLLPDASKHIAPGVPPSIDTGAGTDNSGAALASILNGLQPGYTGDDLVWDDGLMGPASYSDSMVIDWESLEQTINELGSA